MTDPVPVPHDAPMLRVDGATVRKGPGGRRLVLDGVSLTIPLGRHTAILGPNGSGKSSLIKLITQDYRPLAHPSGDPVVQIFGRDRWDVFELRRLLGIVSPDLDRRFTESNGARRLHGLDAVLSGFFASRGVQEHHQVTSAMREQAEAALDRMEASALADKPLGEMSTGETRRVLIARALVSDPPALLLDEPTAGLDVAATYRFLETIRRLAQRGTTVIVVTHHVHEIIPEVSHVVLLRGGRVLADGPKDQVLTSACLSDAFAAPLQVEHADLGYYRVGFNATAHSSAP